MPRQGIMLCYPFEVSRFLKWESKALLQPKYNGERCRAVFNSEGKVTLLSSDMHQITGVPHLIHKLQGTHLRNCELDGELYTHHMDQSMIHSIVSRKVSLNPSYEELGYVVFDFITPQTIEERLQELAHICTNFPPGVSVAPTYLVQSLEEVEGHVTSIYDAGYEGIVLKQLGGRYERKRSTQWMKLKPKQVDVYLIRGTKQEVDIHGKAKQALGAFICQSEGESLFSVGSGALLTRDARNMLWQLRESLPGMYLQIKYQGITQANSVPFFTSAQAVLTKEEAEEWKVKEEENE